MSLILRLAKLSDLNILNNFQQQLVNHEKPFDSGIPTKGAIEYYNINELIKDDNSYFLVAEIDSKLVGCAFGQIRKNIDWAVNKQYGYIGLMFVDEKHRRQKIGKLIVNAIIQWFKTKQISDIRLKVYEKNVSAVNEYRKYGFKDFILELQYSPI